MGECTHKENRPAPSMVGRSRLGAPFAVVQNGLLRLPQRVVMTDASQTSADVVDILKSDHQKARKLMENMEKADADKRKAVLKELRTELLVHSDVEEELVYPAFAKEVGDRDAKVDVAESLEEHHVAKTLLDELKDLRADSIQFDAKMKFLKESVEHHMKEEEKDMFPTLRKAASADRLHALASKVDERKRELQSQYD